MSRDTSELSDRSTRRPRTSDIATPGWLRRSRGRGKDDPFFELCPETQLPPFSATFQNKLNVLDAFLGLSAARINRLRGRLIRLGLGHLTLQVDKTNPPTEV